MWRKSQIQVFWYLSVIVMIYLQRWRFLISQRKEKWGKFILSKKFLKVNVRFDTLLLSFWSLSPYIFLKRIFFVVTGKRNVTYNARRGLLGTLPIGGKIAYHLFNIDAGFSKNENTIRICRKSKWHIQYEPPYGTFVFSFKMKEN